jgi:hypothetical protein
MLKSIKKFLFGLSLERILSDFETMARDLEQHVANKLADSAVLQEIRAEVDSEIAAVEAEAKRAKRVLAKVADLVS